MEFIYCPQCGESRDLEQHACGWKFFCAKCGATVAILRLDKKTNGVLKLFDIALEVEEANKFTGKVHHRTLDKGVSL